MGFTTVGSLYELVDSTKGQQRSLNETGKPFACIEAFHNVSLLYYVNHMQACAMRMVNQMQHTQFQSK